MRERAEGQDEGTERIARDGKQDEEQKARRDEMMRGKELPPTCEFAYLLTCQLAYLLTCLLYLLCFPFRPVLIASSFRQAIREAGRFFLIRSAHSPSSYSQHSAPFSPAHSFRHLAECM